MQTKKSWVCCPPPQELLRPFKLTPNNCFTKWMIGSNSFINIYLWPTWWHSHHGVQESETHFKEIVLISPLQHISHFEMRDIYFNKEAFFKEMSDIWSYLIFFRKQLAFVEINNIYKASWWRLSFRSVRLHQ